MNINIQVRNKIAKGDGQKIVCNNSNYHIIFDFDSEWEKYQNKTLKINFLNHKYEVLFSGNEVDLPPINDAYECEIGVYAGNIRSTTPARFKCEKSIISGDQTHYEPPEDIYVQLLTTIEKLSNERVGIIPQNFEKEERIQARENIKAAAGGDRNLAQSFEEGVVDIKGYNNEENVFTATSDGYIQFRKTGTSAAALHVDNYTVATSSNNQTITIFVAQGMNIWFQYEPNGAFFIPWLVKN